ncbi:MAG: carboxypeptidase M32 [Thermoplasmata archaeon]|jgi:carboxypeptidase Taq|nr:carboxypeptidase M32 [Thermoplasmata archaeon]
MEVSSYNKLMEKYREIELIGSVIRIMDWDMETYMPPNGLTLRSNQLGLMKRISHRMLVSDELGALLKDAENGAGSLGDVERRNLHLLRRERDIATSVPEDLVAAIGEQGAISRDAWVKARSTNAWTIFEPELRKLVDLSIRQAEATMHARGVSTVYDAMIDDNDRGLTQGQVAELLGGMRDSLVPLVRKYGELSSKEDTSVLRRKLPLPVQKEVVKDATTLVGYDTTSESAWGRVDETAHPFTTGYHDDVRITVRYNEKEPLNPLYGGLHEAGHALYERNLNHDWMYQPVGQAVSSGMHEAMSRFVENMIGRSREFWTYYLPRLNTITGGVYRDVDVDGMMRALNVVEPSKIRVDADEVTYSLHIAIRSEIERSLFGGDIDVSELPGVWNDLYAKYLQVEIDNDAEGVLQDIHWSLGVYGGFQGYALGNVYGGMFLKEMDRQLDDWHSEIAKGRPAVAIDWLKDNAQRWASLYDADELMKKVTGSSLTPAPFVEYLRKKHEGLWG